ncbi:MAG TPA: molybdopterin-binding protein, partial [Acidimicrobiales bacterium]|nr:molybdopterin-binding protein [Acidimicrobiales bacterium]
MNPETQQLSDRAPLAKILTVSDSVATGRGVDGSGPALSERLASSGYTVTELRVSADGRALVASALKEMTRDFGGLILTTGGT